MIFRNLGEWKAELDFVRLTQGRTELSSYKLLGCGHFEVDFEILGKDKYLRHLAEQRHLSDEDI